VSASTVVRIVLTAVLLVVILRNAHWSVGLALIIIACNAEAQTQLCRLRYERAAITALNRREK
jgi:hypothetical protein